jgi:hypothetical protein
MAEYSQHPMTAEEFYEQVRGFYELLERLTEAVEWFAEDMYRQHTEGERTKPPHMPWNAE